MDSQGIKQTQSQGTLLGVEGEADRRQQHKLGEDKGEDHSASREAGRRNSVGAHRVPASWEFFMPSGGADIKGAWAGLLAHSA